MILLNERESLLPYLLPFTDIDSHSGYILNYGNHVIMSFFICVSNVGNDCTFAMMINTLWAAVDITKHSINELKISVNSNDHLIYSNKIIHEVFLEIQDLDRFISQWKDMFYVKFFYAPIAIPVSISVAIVCILVVSNAMCLFKMR